MIFIQIQNELLKLTDNRRIADKVRANKNVTYYEITRETHKTNTFSGNLEETYTIISCLNGQKSGDINLLYINGKLDSVMRHIPDTTNSFEQLTDQQDIEFLNKIIDCNKSPITDPLILDINVTKYLLELERHSLKELENAKKEALAKAMDSINEQYDSSISNVEAELNAANQELLDLLGASNLSLPS